MKITHVIPNLEVGGAQRLIENLIPYFNKGNEIEVIVFQKTDSEIESNLEKLGIRIVYLDISFRSPKAILKLRKYFKNTDIVHLHLFPVQYYSIIANIGINKPLIFTEHSTYNKRRKYKFLSYVEKVVYGKIDKIVSISKGVQANLTNWLREKENSGRFIIVENGVKPPVIKSKTKSDEYLFGREGKALIMISRFSDSKDQDTVVKSLKYIKDKDVFLVLVGDGYRKQEVEDLVAKESLTNRVVFLGTRNDIYDLISESFIGIQSSNWEGFGLSVIEMMVGGLPVVASDIEGLRDVVEEAGILFEKGNEKDLADKINKLLTNEQQYQLVKGQCKQRGEEYLIEKTASKYLDLYKEMIR